LTAIGTTVVGPSDRSHDLISTRSRGKADGRYERNVKPAPRWSKLLFEAQTYVGKSAGESGRSVVIEKIVRGRKAKLGFFGDAKSYRCFGEIIGPLAPIAGLLEPVLKLQASTGVDNSRTCDLRPVCGNRAFRIGAASLSLRLEHESSRHDGNEQRTRTAQHAEDSNGRPVFQVSHATLDSASAPNDTLKMVGYRFVLPA